MIELVLNDFQSVQDLGELGGLVGFPILLRSETDAAAVGPAALVRAAEGGGGGPCGGDEFGNCQSRGKDLRLKRGDVLNPDKWVIHRGDGVLPDEDFRRDFRSEIAVTRPHVAVGELEPSPSEGVGELVWIREEITGNFLVGGIGTHGDVGGEHAGGDFLSRVVGMGDGAGARAILGSPLVGTGGAFGEFPFVAEEVLEIVIAPLGGSGGPSDLEAAGNGVRALAAAEAAFPAESLFGKAG